MVKKLHLVAFDVPYPTNYGGVIDIFYKIKALHQLNVEIYLHVFEYGKGKQTELNKYCKAVYYYKRNPYLSSILDFKIPFIVKSRGNAALIQNLKQIKAPILFDGLHTTYVLTKTEFNNQELFVRTHNVEHKFYEGLAQSETNIFKKIFYNQEARKLKSYENILTKVNGIFSISPYEQTYFLSKYGEKSSYIPAFHFVPNQTKLSEKGSIILYHGYLLVSENKRAADFLINTYKNTPYHLVVASNYENKKLIDKIAKIKNISFEKLASEAALKALFDKAHINVLPTFQKTGIKLKLLNSLYQSRFTIGNDFMINDTGLEDLVEKANTKEEFLAKTELLFQKSFTDTIQKQRFHKLEEINPLKSAEKMIKLLFKQ